MKLIYKLLNTLEKNEVFTTKTPGILTKTTGSEVVRFWQKLTTLLERKVCAVRKCHPKSLTYQKVDICTPEHTPRPGQQVSGAERTPETQPRGKGGPEV